MKKGPEPIDKSFIFSTNLAPVFGSHIYEYIANEEAKISVFDVNLLDDRASNILCQLTADATSPASRRWNAYIASLLKPIAQKHGQRFWKLFSFLPLVPEGLSFSAIIDQLFTHFENSEENQSQASLEELKLDLSRVLPVNI